MEIIKKCKKKKRIFFTRYAKYIINILNSSELQKAKSYILTWNQIQPNFYIKAKRDKPFISPTNKDFKDFFNFLKKNGIKQKFICFNNRDSNYLNNNKYFIKDRNYHDYRDFKFNDFKPSIDFLSQKYSVIRIGDVQEKYFYKRKNFYDMTNENYNERYIVLFTLLAKFNVISLTGLHNLVSSHGKRSLYVNFIPFDLDLLSHVSADSIVIPKAFYSRELKRNLNFSEICNLGINVHNALEKIKNNKLDVINNTPEDIFKGIKEMEDSLLKKTNKKYLIEQNKFWDIFKKKEFDKVNFLKTKLRISISNNYLLKNSNLLH
jgi:putative glycosyltransferase (TIGR04372 family)